MRDSIYSVSGIIVVSGVLALLITLSALVARDAQAADERPGTVITLKPDALPAPIEKPFTLNLPKLLDSRPDGVLAVPEGFSSNVYADKLTHPRKLKSTPNGDILLAESKPGKITLLRDTNADGKADLVETFAEGFKTPYGIALAYGGVYIADLDGVWRIPYQPGDTKARAPQQRITPEGSFGKLGGHATRNIIFSPDLSQLYVSIGSSGNILEDPAPRATIQVFDMDPTGAHASNQRTFASGIRNAVGIAFYPGTENLYAAVNERETLGDEIVPDYVTRVVEGKFYGWPYSYLGQRPQPGFADKRPDLVKVAVMPDVLLRAHSAPLGMTFYAGSAFPVPYRTGAFVALHGSGAAVAPRSYYVVYIPFKDGKPAGGYQVFTSGLWVDGVSPAQVLGRPTDVEVAADGSLLIADDTSNRIWRVSYGLPKSPTH